MSKVEYLCPVKLMSGAFGKDHTTIFRRKKHTAYGANIDGAQEVFHRNMRDYKRTPLRPGEQQSVNRFKVASAYIRTWWNSDIDIMSQNPHFQYWHTRWLAQLKKPERGYRTDKLGYPKPYIDFRAYVRAMYMRGERMPDADVLN